MWIFDKLWGNSKASAQHRTPLRLRATLCRMLIRADMWIDLELYTNNLRVQESEANKGGTGTSDIVNADVQGEP